jgi:hypothetical protein
MDKYMKKTIIILALSATVTGHMLAMNKTYSFAIPTTTNQKKTFTQPTPITTVDPQTGFLKFPVATTNKTISPADMVTEDIGKVPLATAISTKTANKSTPYYMLAVAVSQDKSGNYVYTYYDAAKIKKMSESNPGRQKQPAASPGTTAEVKMPWNMVDAQTKNPILEVYFYILEKPTDTALKFLCTGMEMFGGPGTEKEDVAKRQKFRNVLNAITDPDETYKVEKLLKELKG